MENKSNKKALGFYFGMASAAIALVTGIALLVYGNAVADFYAMPSVILIVGAGLSAIGLMKNIHWLAILPGACYISAFAAYLSSQLGNISGRMSDNGLGITGTTLNMLYLFLALMLAAMILAVIASFMNQKKEA